MKLHPLTIPYRGLSRAISLGSAVFFIGVFGAGFGSFGGPLAVFLLAFVAFLAGFVWEVAYYRRFEYALTVDTLDINSGVISRRERDIPLGRIQNVDISSNVLQRALGIAAVEFETAGGGSAEAVLHFVSYDEAKRLQRELRRRKAGVAEEPGAIAEPEPAGETLFELAGPELALLSAISFDARIFVPLLFVLGPLAGTAMNPYADITSVVTLFAGLFGSILLVVTAWGLSAAATFSRYYGFRLSRMDDELRYERGLLQRYDGSIPTDKIQTVALKENVLKRRLGYATLAVETAGYAPGQSPSGGSEAAVPLATRDRALALARSIEDFADLDFERPPRRARRRYVVRYLLVLVGLTVVLALAHWFIGGRIGSVLSTWYVPLVLVPVAPVAAHFKWASRGYHVGEEHFVTRNGFWWRTTTVVPYYRTQTIIEGATVFQRRWRLASVIVDTAGSRSLLGKDAAAIDIDREVAAELCDVVGEGLVTSRRRRRVGRHGTSSSSDATP